MHPRSAATGRRALGLALVAIGAAAMSTPFGALAQPADAWPAKAVRVVVPYPPGGANDLIARFVTQKLAEDLHQPFVVDNRPGATGLIGTDAVAKSPADGYTLLVSASVHVIYPALFKKVPFDPLKDFAPVSQLGRAPMVLSVNPGLPVRSVAELIAYAKANPKALQYASSGNGSATHLAAEAFKVQTGIEMQHIAYKGGALAMNDVLGGQVQVIFDPVGSSMPFLRSGRLRPLAVTSAARSPALPDLPAVGEAVRGYDVITWYGLWAPAGTPQAIVDKLASAVDKALKSPNIQKELTQRGIDPVGGTAAEFAAYNKSESTKWARIVKETGATLD